MKEETRSDGVTEGYSEFMREIHRRFSRVGGATFMAFAAKIAKEITVVRLNEFLAYRKLAEAAGDAGKVDSVLIEVLQGRRSVDSALESAAELVKGGRAESSASSPEVRVALRHALSDVAESVSLLTQPTEEFTDDPIPGLRAAFQRLRQIPIETEIEPADLQTLKGVLDLIDSHLPALRLCSDYRDHWKMLMRRAEYHQLAEQGNRAFVSTEFWRDPERRLVRLAGRETHFHRLAGEEMFCGTLLAIRAENPRSLVVDISGARSIAFPAVQSLLAIADITRSRRIAFQIAAGELHAKLVRLLPEGLIPIRRTYAECSQDLRDQDRRGGSGPEVDPGEAYPEL